MRIFYLILALVSLLRVDGRGETSTTNGWQIKTSLKYDAFCFINAISKEEFHNRFYQRDYTFWQARLGASTVDTINTIIDSIGPFGFKACYLFTYINITSLNDIILALKDSVAFEKTIVEALVANKDFRYEASINDLQKILSVRKKLLFVLHRMNEEKWEDDWKTIANRLEYDIKRKQKELTRYSPQFLKAEVSRFLGINSEQRDSSSTVYYLYYAFPNGYKLPFNMMAGWSIEEPKYFFSVYIHEMLHFFSIYVPDFIKQHENLVNNSPRLSDQREILITKLFSSDDEFYVLAAEAYLSVKLGIRTDHEAVEYLKSSNGGTVLFSLFIYDFLMKHFSYKKQSYESFLKDSFFKKIKPQDIERFLETMENSAVSQER